MTEQFKKTTIGILGGGQLGRMLSLAATNMGYEIITYTLKNGEQAPAQSVSSKIIYAEFDDKKQLNEFAKECDIVTFEFENIPAETVKLLESKTIVRPNSSAIYNTQHRLRERNFLKENKFPTHKFWEIKTATDIEKAFKNKLQKAVLKTAAFGYDGKGQRIIKKGEDYKKVWEECKFGLAVLEEFIPFEKEISVVLARGVKGDIETFPIGQNIHKDGILKTSIIPAKISAATKKQAIDVASKIAKKLDYIGVMAVEFFVLKNGKILVNEIAPRVHNSGHYTQDACNVSQFTQHIRAICGLPLIKPTLVYKKAKMENLIGDDIFLVEKYLKQSNARVHLYGKTEVKQNRKMGHVNFVG
ncbi:MAG TPA: 5-(carboxyamino)imidazole ribonucleotide synthase [Alphaproteobacteria bacterium]|nr:5-(carboxyamino)imidazole ribonucleotide synthase [Alphaproteobacteria bacterium]